MANTYQIYGKEYVCINLSNVNKPEYIVQEYLYDDKLNKQVFLGFKDTNNNFQNYYSSLNTYKCYKTTNTTNDNETTNIFITDVYTESDGTAAPLQIKYRPVTVSDKLYTVLIFNNKQSQTPRLLCRIKFGKIGGNFAYCTGIHWNKLPSSAKTNQYVITNTNNMTSFNYYFSLNKENYYNLIFIDTNEKIYDTTLDLNELSEKMSFTYHAGTDILSAILKRNYYALMSPVFSNTFTKLSYNDILESDKLYIYMLDSSTNTFTVFGICSFKNNSYGIYNRDEFYDILT